MVPIFCCSEKKIIFVCASTLKILIALFPIFIWKLRDKLHNPYAFGNKKIQTFNFATGYLILVSVAVRI